MEEWLVSGEAQHVVIIIGAVILVGLGYQLFIFCYDHSLLGGKNDPTGTLLRHGGGMGIILIGIGGLVFVSLVFSGRSSSSPIAGPDSAGDLLRSSYKNEIPPAPEWPPQDRFAAIGELMEGKENVEVGLFPDMVKGEPLLDDNDEIDLMIGVNLFREGKYAEAQAAFQAVADHGSSSYRSRAWFHSGECMLAMGEPDRAILHYQEALGLGGDKEWLARAMYQQAEAFSMLGNSTIASHLRSRLVRLYPTTVEGRVASLELHQVAFKE